MIALFAWAEPQPTRNIRDFAARGVPLIDPWQA